MSDHKQVACQCFGSNWYRSFIVSVDTKGGLDKCARTFAYGSRLVESLMDRFVLQPELVRQKALSEAGRKQLAESSAAGAAGAAAPALVLSGSTAALQNFLNKLKLFESALSNLRRGTRVPGLPGHIKQFNESLSNLNTVTGWANFLKLAVMIPYFPLDNLYWFIKIGVFNTDAARALQVARISVICWGISLVFAGLINVIKLRAQYAILKSVLRLRSIQRAAQTQTLSAAQSLDSAAVAQSQAVLDASAIQRFIHESTPRAGLGAPKPDPNLLACLQRNGIRHPDSVTAVNAAIAASAKEIREQWVDFVKNATDMVVALSDGYYDWSRVTTGIFGTIASVLGWYASWPAPPKS